MSRKENKQGPLAGGPTAQGDLALSAGLCFLTPQLDRDDLRSDYKRHMRPHGLWGGLAPQVLMAAHQAEEGPCGCKMVA